VQSLNKAHIEKLSYIDDINRNNGEEGWANARISAENWKMIEGFVFNIDEPATRLSRASIGFLQLLFWAMILLVLINKAGRQAL
jgi:ABC-2 type transport system permease protein